MTCFDPAIVDAEYCPNDEALWAGFRPWISLLLQGDVQVFPTWPARASNATDKSEATGAFTVKTGKKWVKFQLQKEYGTDDFMGKGNGGEYRFKARIQHTNHNLKLIEDLAGCELYAVVNPFDHSAEVPAPQYLIGHADFPAKIDRASIKASKGKLSDDGKGRYIDFDIVSMPYSPFSYTGVIAYTIA